MPSNIKHIQNLKYIKLKKIVIIIIIIIKFTQVLFWWGALHPQQYYKVL